jgi:hypothetical protein
MIPPTTAHFCPAGWLSNTTVCGVVRSAYGIPGLIFGSGKSAGDGGSGAWEKDAEGLETRRTVDAGAIVLVVVEGYAVRIGAGKEVN